MTDAMRVVVAAIDRLPDVEQDELAGRIALELVRGDDRWPETDEWGAEPAIDVFARV